MIIAGTGSRSLHNASAKLRADIVFEISLRLMSKNPEFVISGMAEGFDELLARQALNMRIPLWCAIPNHGYGAHYWGERSLSGQNRLKEFLAIVERAEKVTYVMEDIHHSKALSYKGRHSNFWRNDFMVEQADQFLVYDPSSRGTKQCLGSIIAANKPYTIIPGE
jgi:hypothetical protein